MYSDYDPNAGNGGGNNGGAQNGSTPSTSKKGLFENQNPEDITNLTPGITPPADEDKQPEQDTDKPKEKEFITQTNGSEKTSWWWLLWVIGLVLVLGSLLWFVIARRRHHDSTPTWR